MSQITESTAIVAADETLSTTLDGESVILHTGSGEYFGFNQVGTDIWELLNDPHTIDEIADHIANEYDVTEERCREDIYEWVEESMEKNLVEMTNE